MDTRTPLIGGAVLGGLVVLLQIVSAVAGLDALFPLVATGVEVAVLLGVLARTRGTQGFGQQLGAGLLTTVVSLPLVLVGFCVTVFVLFPGSVPPELVVAQGAAGLIGTLVTGVLVSLVAAFFMRTSR